MTFSNILAKIYFLTKTNSVSFPTADVTILANNALERVVSLILQSDGRWEFDDSNHTDLPVATTALVSAQQSYGFETSHIEIERVELKDQQGNWRKLQPLDQADVYDQSLTDFLKGGGTPVYYDKIATSIFLYPSPDFSQNASLKINYSRPPVSFLVTDTTEQPGFNSLYHDLIALWVSYEYSFANGISTADKFLEEIIRKEEALKEAYALRSKDEHIRISAKKYKFN